jgi:hypothetical protein
MFDALITNDVLFKTADLVPELVTVMVELFISTDPPLKAGSFKVMFELMVNFTPFEILKVQVLQDAGNPKAL